MKILMLCEFYNEQLEYQENLLAKYYVKHGHAVTVVTSTHESVFDYYADRHDNRRPSRTYEHGGAKIVKLRYRYNILHRLKALERIDALLEAEAPDLIFVHDIMLNLPECVSYVRRHPRTRMILDYHADYSNSGKNALSLRVLHGVCRKWFLDRARPHLSRIFPIVPASATFLHEVYGVPMADMELLPLGADSDVAHSVAQSSARDEVRDALRIPGEAPVIFTGGKLAAAKRTECLFDATAGLSRPLHIIVAGRADEKDAAYEAELRRRASEGVHFVGWLSPVEIYRHLAASDLAVFPASQSILWQQAIAMGLPLIVGDTGHQDISYLNQGNIVILPRERIAPEPLARAIADVLDHPERRGAMAEAARRVADEHLNWDRLIERTLRFNEGPAA